jgi:hypothetical protein
MEHKAFEGIIAGWIVSRTNQRWLLEHAALADDRPEQLNPWYADLA